MKQPNFFVSDCPGRLDGVDLLRGLAIFFVLMNHVNMRLVLAKLPYTQGLPAQLVHSLVWNGQYGVQMFFAVSGFLITATSLRRWGALSQINVREFYALRFARLAPLLLLLLAVLCALHGAGFKNFMVSAKAGGLGRALLAAATFHVNVLEANRGYLPGSWDVLWSLSVEEMFYLFFPWVCLALGRRRGQGLILLLVAFVLTGPFARTVLSDGNEVWREYSYLGGMDAIALGCLTAIGLSTRRSWPRVGWLGSLGIGSMILVLCFATWLDALGLVRSGLDMTICAIGTCMVTAAAAQTRWRSPLLIAPLRRMGQNSYEIYLTHMFVVFSLFDGFVAMGSPVLVVPLLFIGVIVVAGVLGEGAARGYSEPLNRWLRERWGAGQ